MRASITGWLLGMPDILHTIYASSQLRGRGGACSWTLPTAPARTHTDVHARLELFMQPTQAMRCMSEAQRSRDCRSLRGSCAPRQSFVSLPSITKASYWKLLLTCLCGKLPKVYMQYAHGRALNMSVRQARDLVQAFWLIRVQWLTRPYQRKLHEDGGPL